MTHAAFSGTTEHENGCFDALGESITYGYVRRNKTEAALRNSSRVISPTVPLASNTELFSALCAKGADLVALHLLEDDYPAASWNVSKPKGKSQLRNLVTKFAGKGDAEVAKGHPRYTGGKVYINPMRWFEGVPEKVRNFHVGGYQVCEKWLKDRRGRTLSEDDIAHYQNIVAALAETTRIMGEIDEVIDRHGGWPGAFASPSTP